LPLTRGIVMRAILASVALLGLAGCDALAGGSSAIPADTLLAVGEGQETAA